MPKRKRVAPASSAPSNNKELRAYFKSYKGGGTKDIHFPVFEATKNWTGASRVLYPGCHRHLTTSLFFPHVTYVDIDKKVASLYRDEKTKDYVDKEKVYQQETNYEFLNCNVLQKGSLKKSLGKKREKFDILICLSAGVIAAACSDFIEKNGHLLVNDSHSDARSIFAMNPAEWRLVAYWDNDSNGFTDENLDQCFQVVPKKGTKKESATISKEQVEESINVGSISKRSFRMIMDSNFYLFRRL